MADIIIAGVLALLTFLSAYLGIHVSMHPPTDEEKRRYKVAFLGCAVVIFCLVILQAYRAQKTQSDTSGTLGRIEHNTKEPANITINTSETRDPPLVTPGAPNPNIPHGTLQVSKWQTFPTDGRPVGAHMHLLNTWPTPKVLTLTQASKPVLLSQIKNYEGKTVAEDDIWSFLMGTIKDRPLQPMELPPNNPDQYVQIDLNEDTKKLIATGDYGAVVAIAGRDSTGTVVFEACAFLTDRPNEVMLCNKHNRTSLKIN